MKTVFGIFAALLLSGTAYPHEGHDHDGPVKVQAPKGGIIKMREADYVEVVSKGNAFTVYLYDKDLKAQNPKDYTVSAKVQKPRSKKAEDVKLEAKEMAFEGSYDAKGAHRYTLILSVKNAGEDHGDKLKYTIEPKK
jgi:hypothetical protein